MSIIPTRRHAKATLRAPRRHNQQLFPRKRTGTFIATLVVVSLLATVFVWRHALAANILWTSAGGSAWLTGSNWTGGVVPGAADVAQFGVNPTSGTTGVGINFNGTTNAGVQINGQKIQEVGAVEITSARAAAFLIGNSSGTSGATGMFRLNGATVNSIPNTILRNNSGQLFTIRNTQGSGTQTMSVLLNNATDNIINIDGAGGITISSIITDAGGNHISLGGVGAGTLTLSGANTYTGGTTINGARLTANANSALGTGNVNVNTTGVGLTLEGAFNNFIANAATVNIAAGAQMALNHTGGSDTVAGLVLGGVAQTSPGTYGSTASGATFQSDTFFTGTGTLTLSVNPSLSINDVSQNEGNAGTTSFTFTVSLTSTVHGGVTFDICSADGTAQDDNPPTEDNDYTVNCLTGQTIANGSDSYQFTVDVSGDATIESNETFFVNLTNVVGATVVDGQGQGTIINDDVILTLISQVQGSGTASPVVGTSVSVRGIVTLLRSNGFFIQEEVGDNDADPNTSEGIFVFTSSAPAVAVGDQATVTGTVVEFNTLTELSSPTVSINSTGNTLPTAVTLDSTILAPNASPTQPQLEKYEGMRMTGSLTTVAPNNQFFEVLTVLSSVARPMREPGIPVSDPIPPDPTSGLPDANIPIWDENPERLLVDTDGRAGSTGLTLTSNVSLGTVTGPLDFGFGSYRLIPDAVLTPSSNMAAVPLPTPLASEFTVASYNIENFTNNATQREKVSLTVRTILHYPDVIGVVEIDDLSHLQALASDINADAVTAGDPDPQYFAYLTEGNVEGGGDQNQNVGFLVKTTRLTSVTVTQEREEETYTPPGGSTTFLHDRPPLVLDGIVDASGPNPRRIIVVVNHLRSFIDIELVAGDGPRVREKRKKQAESLADLLNDLQTANPGVPVISVGDYNEYQFNSGYDDSLSVIKGNPTPDDQIVVDQSPDLVNPNLTNLTDTQAAAERYSFMFDGTPQALDHHVVNTAALARNTRIVVARVNSDYPESPPATYASNAATPERNSDHDPVVSYYSLNQAQAAGSVIISEFRFRGPGFISGPPAPVLLDKIAMPGIKMPTLAAVTNQPEDEFIEIYNNTNSDITVTTTDGSPGWALVASDGVTRFIIPNGTVIPARGHFLGVNTTGYSLAHYGGLFAASGDVVLLADGVTQAFGYTQDIPDGSGIALFRTANSVNFTLAERLDAAGYTGVPELYREGGGFPTGGAEITSNLEHTFFRAMTRATNGLPKDTGDNTADFFLADTASTDFDPGPSTVQRLGAPGPENLSSPINRTAQFGFSLFDTGVPAGAVPNRERSTTPVANGTFGTLTIRRTFTNNTGQALSRLRFRLVDVSTFPSPVGSGLADLRALTSSDECVGGGTPPLCIGGILVRGTTLEQPPSQAIGGGWNSTVRVEIFAPSEETASAKVLFDTPKTGTIVLGSPLNNGESINVQFRLGVMQTGFFFFYINIESSPGCPIESALRCDPR